MFQDGAFDENLAMARRQAFSTTTRSTDVTSPRSTTVTDSPTTTQSRGLPKRSVQLAAIHEIITDTDFMPAGYCTAALPSGGVIRFNDTFAITLGDTISFQAPCDNSTIFAGNGSATGNSTVISFGDPFYASTSPQIYALATATVLSYLLVVILFVTPRTFYAGSPSGSSAYHGSGASGLFGRGMTLMGTGSGSSSVLSVGQRPLLQKIAAITVAVSLTIATSDTFTVAEAQYSARIMDSNALVRQVIGSLEIRITRVISDAFLWLAQVQTLIRLFPRHKEKVTIKWLGFGLVTCDTVFSILENFVSQSNRTRPESFTDAIPAISYLFELAISIIYASCVVYYSLSKRRFAFWHAKMRNMCILSLLGLSSVLIPVVFFIVDVAQPDIATWGEYIRWVGAAAASVVVWEWVERIEALERDEKKDGILGREIFDGDEMLDMPPSEDVDYGGGVHFGSQRKKNKESEKNQMWKNVRDLNFKPQLDIRSRLRKVGQKNEKTDGIGDHGGITVNGITRPAQVATPISRAETNSASTTYAVRYHNPLSPSPAIPEDAAVGGQQPAGAAPQEVSDESTLTNTTEDDQSPIKRNSETESGILVSGRQRWQSVSNPFKRKRAEPPAEVAAQINESNMRRSPAEKAINFRNRLNTFTATQKAKFVGRDKAKTPLQVTVIPAQRRVSQIRQSEDSTTTTDADVESGAAVVPQVSRINEEASRQSSLHVTVIPAPIRGGRTWSPDDLRDAPNEDATPRSSGFRTPSGPRNSTLPQSTPSRPSEAFASSPTQQRANTSSISLVSHHIRASPNLPHGSDRPGTNFESRQPGRDRGVTMTSISDRLTNNTPPTMAISTTPSSGRRSAGQDIVNMRPTPPTSPETPNRVDRLRSNINGGGSNIQQTPITQFSATTQPQEGVSHDQEAASSTSVSHDNRADTTNSPSPPTENG